MANWQNVFLWPIKMTTISQVTPISTNFEQNKIPTSSTNDFYTIKSSILVVLWHPSAWQTPLHKDDEDNAEPVTSDHNTDTALNSHRVGIVQPWPLNSAVPARHGNSSLWEDLEKCSVVNVWTTCILMASGSSVASMIWFVGLSLLPLWMHHKRSCPVHVRTIKLEQNIGEKIATTPSGDDTTSIGVLVFQSTSVYIQ